jgi:molecular chaperone GrpE (heat shock protein)
MLAELASFTAAYKTVKGAVQAGRELVTVASSIGTMVQSKDDLQKKLSKRSNSPFSSKVQTDLEEFLALEEIRQAEKDLELLMVYTGRIGLKDDWLRYQAEARKKRKEAERQAQKEREELMENIAVAVGIFVGFALVVGALAGLVWYVKGF